MIGCSNNESNILSLFKDSAVLARGENKLYFSASNLPPDAIFISESATFSWDTLNTKPGVYDRIKFEVCDGELFDTEEISITVTEK